jgi:outer membrane receptor protein involved in Fe transport
MGVGGYSNSQPYFDLYFAAIGNTGLYTQNSLNRGRQWNITDTFRWHVKDHLLSFGMDYRRLLSPLAPASPAVYAEFDYPSSVLANAFDYSQVTNTIDATPIFNETSLFLQDEWQVAKHLSLSLGLRWEINPPLGAENGNVPYTLSGNIGDPSTLTLAPHGTPLWKTTWYNLAPRLGVAWTAHAEPGWETVLRGGGGVFFDNANALASDGYDAVGFSAYQEYFGSPLPFTHAQINFPATTIFPTGNEVDTVSGHHDLLNEACLFRQNRP